MVFPPQIDYSWLPNKCPNDSRVRPKRDLNEIAELGLDISYETSLVAWTFQATNDNSKSDVPIPIVSTSDDMCTIGLGKPEALRLLQLSMQVSRTIASLN